MRPYPENPGATHYAGCWKDKGHHHCAVWYCEQWATTFRAYQAALNDPTYWEPNGREQNQQQVGEAFDRLVQLTNTILGDV